MPQAGSPLRAQCLASQSPAAPAKPSCPQSETFPLKPHSPAPRHRLVAKRATAPASSPPEANDRGHRLVSPAQYRNRGPARDAETHHPANESADRILTRRNAPPHSDPLQPLPVLAAVSQSATVRRRSRAVVRQDQPAIPRESCARSLAKAHRSEFSALSAVRPTKSRTEFSPTLPSRDSPR